MSTLQAQELDPRSYTWIPVRTTFIVAGFGYSQGGVVTDPAAPIQDLNAKVESPLLGFGRSFNLFGQTAQASATIPFAWGQASGSVLGEEKSTSRQGFSDIRFRVSWLFHGAPAATPAVIVQASHRAILGASFTVITPTGQYFPDKLINLSTNRWSFKPELALSQPLGKRWLIDLYAGIWLFTKNYSFYPGNSVRSQDPMGSFQTHISYNIRPRLWAAFDATFYTGGMTSVDDNPLNDRQSNSRLGGTFVFPVGKRHSVKIAASRGVIVRYGANFTTIAIGWQTFFIGKSGQKKHKSENM